MKIVTIIPFFRESPTLAAECFRNVESYADAAVVCVNDRYNRDTEDFLRSFPIIKQVAFVNKDTFSDAIFNSSLLTMAQSLRPDWLVKQDIDEEFEPRFADIREFLSRTEMDWISVLWPSYVQDRTHHCYYHQDILAGTSKHVLYRFDLSRLYVPAGSLTNLEMADAQRGVLNIRMFHKNLLKSDQENYTKFVRSGRESAHDLCVANLRKESPEVLRVGENEAVLTYQKRDRDAAAYLLFCFTAEEIDLAPALVSDSDLTRAVLTRSLMAFYPTQEVATRLEREVPKVRKRNPLLRAAVALAVKTGVNKHLYSAIQRVRAALS